MKFAKMQGLGNDFVVVGGEVVVTPELVRRLCDRRFGVGADGVLRVSATEGAVTMEYWNADGSTAEMCGNGLRCVARRAVDLGMVEASRFLVGTPVGLRRVEVGDDVVSVDLGPIRLLDDIEIGGLVYRTVDVGNPHAVAESDPEQTDVATIGRRVEVDSSFPEGTNVEFFARRGPAEVTMRVWERGVGETLACGTGIAAVAAVARDGAPDGQDSIKVHTRGGTAKVSFLDGVWLAGPADTVFEGIWLNEPS